MVDHVGRAGFHGVQVGFAQLAPGRAAVPAHGPHRRHQHRRADGQAALAGLDVHELLKSQVGAESGLGDDVVGVAQGQAVGDDGAATVGDVAEGPGVDNGGLAFHRLHQVGHDGVAHHGHERAFKSQVAHRHRRAAAVGSHHHAGEAGAQVVQVGGQRQDRHDFRGGDEIEAGFTERAVGAAAQAGGDLPQRPVGGVGHARPGDAFGGHVVGVVAIDGVLHQRGQQVVGGTHRVGVAGEVDVDFVLGDDTGLAAAGSAALDAEDRAQRGFAQVDDRLVAQPAQPVGQSDGRGGLALAGGGGRDAGDDHQLALRRVGFDGVQADLGLVAPEGDEVFLVKAKPFCHRVDWVHFAPKDALLMLRL